jgi:uncharacterized membrane protein
MNRLRRWFLAGLLVLVPLGITVWVVNFVFKTMDGSLDLLPASFHPDRLLGFHLPGLGLLVTLLVVLMVGAAASNYVGSKLLGWWDGLLVRIPFVRSIYSGVKQVSDTLFSEKGNAFRKAILLQYPREGLWTIGFLTGAPGGELPQHLSGEYISVYVPTTPNPTSGFFLMVKKSETVELRMSVDEALKYVISMGVVSPAAHAPHKPV